MDEGDGTNMIEDLPLGYPRLVGVLTAEPQFFVARRFLGLFARRVLLAQDRLSDLEAQLERLDRAELHRLNLASCRHDKNLTRTTLLQDIDSALQKYEAAVASYRTMHSLPSPSSMDIASLSNWFNNNKPLIEDESRFVTHTGDLFSLAPRNNIGGLDRVMRRALIALTPGAIARKMFASKDRAWDTKDRYTYLRSSRRIDFMAKIVGVMVIVVLLMVPLVLLYFIGNGQARLGIIVASTLLVALFLAFLTQSRRVEVFAGTAAYCAILAVFVTNLN